MPSHAEIPRGFERRILLGSPRRHRHDVLQEAWLGYLAGRNPNTVARNYLARETLHERREQADSQLAREPRRRYARRSETAGRVS